VAERLAAQAPRHIDIVYTGLLHGEKLHEDLFGYDEIDTRPAHPLVSHVNVPRLAEIDALALDPWGQEDQLMSALRACAFGTDVYDGSFAHESVEGARL
jgi:FlaA1/EpsC-like NDP-sugar epimerase